MNGSGRKYTSKWDLKEDSHIYHENVQGDMLRTKHGGPVSRNRGNDDYGNNMRSPGLEEWSRRDRTSSPRNSLSRSLRSRSRSPVDRFERHSEFNDRIRSRAGLTTQPCKDFAVGRCKRGSYCQYSHSDNGDHETAEREENVRRYHDSRVARDHYSKSDRSTEICNKFLKGTCLRGSSCKYIHDSASNAHNQGSSDEIFRERESNRSNRYRTYEQRDERGSGTVPCRYFAAGNCRNGRHCRFSHGQPSSSPDRKSRDHNWGQHHNVDAAEKVFKEPKWSNPNSVSESVPLRENRSEIISDEEQKATRWSVDEARGPSYNSENRMLAVQNERNKAFGGFEQKEFLLENEAIGSTIGVSGPRSTGSLPVETTMSPFWNYNVQASNQSFTPELKTGNGDKVQAISELSSENVVSDEQLNQLNNLSTTLAQLIANGQQLPQIYASLNSRVPVDTLSPVNSGGVVEPVPPASYQTDSAVPSKQYDPLSDSGNLDHPSINNQHSNLPTELVVSSMVNSEQAFQDNAPIFGASANNNNLQKDIQSESCVENNTVNLVAGLMNSEVTGKNEGAHLSEKLQDDDKVAEGGPLENENTIGKVEEGKKSKNMKGLRSFKFALVDVVKELLKPAWKEGKIDKEVHKTIVKKAVDKVTGALQEVNIPQTKEKIDSYLSSSKPKLTKLVEAYVEKFQKSKPEQEAA